MNDVVADRMGGPSRRVARGRWAVEVRGDEVADVRFDGVLLLRAVRPVVRDRDWNTVPVTVVGQESTARGLVTSLLFDDREIRYAATVTLALDDDTLAVDLHGRALCGFVRNRIGLVVLHPAADAGRAVRVTHTDGRVAAGVWPTDISPHQPFRDVAGFEWTTDGVAAALSLSGEVFETEDQRNWTDASFKTYGTPLARPFPVQVAAGEAVAQGVRLTATGRTSRRVVADDDDAVTVTAEVVGAMPPISLGAALYPPPARLPALPGIETVVVELTGDAGRWPGHLREAARQAAALGAGGSPGAPSVPVPDGANAASGRSDVPNAAIAPPGLDVRIVTDDVALIEQAAALLTGVPVVRVGVFDPRRHLPTPALWEALRAAAPADVALVGGTRAHFTELNRQIGDIPPDAPVLAFSLTPQMHATEVPHLVDSLDVQGTVARNALRLACGRPVLVGPVTLARRFNAVATSAARDPAVEADRAVDPLQPTAFAGAWTLGSVAVLAPTGVAGLCYFEPAGPRGVAGPDGTLTPAGRVLAALAPLRGRPLLRCTAPAGVAALAVGTGAVFLANLSTTPRTVDVSGHGTVELDGWAVRRLPL